VATSYGDIFRKKGKVVKNLVKLDFGDSQEKTNSENGESCSGSGSKKRNKVSRKASKISVGDISEVKEDPTTKLTAKILVGEEKLSPLVRGLLSAAKEDDNEEILQELSTMNESTKTAKFSEGLSSSSSGSNTARTVTNGDERGYSNKDNVKGSPLSSAKKSSRGNSASSGSQCSNAKEDMKGRRLRSARPTDKAATHRKQSYADKVAMSSFCGGQSCERKEIILCQVEVNFFFCFVSDFKV
jgi:hypothetical protein